MKKLTFFITGTSSFMGSSVAEYLCKNGHDVIGLARNKSAERIQNLVKNKNFQLIESDLLENFEIKNEIDLIFHAAAQANNMAADVRDYIKNHVLATKKILDFSERNKSKRFIFCSSMLIYGQIREKIVMEGTERINPNLQGMCKYIGELLMQEKIATSSIALRIPGVVGTWAHNVWLSKVFEKALKNEDIKIFNGNELFNNTIHIEDIAKFIESLASEKWKGFDCINIASKNPISVRKTVEIMLSSLKSKSSIIEEKMESVSFTISIEKAKRLYNFSPMTTEETVKMYGSCH